jgi:hypothetical protein
MPRHDIRGRIAYLDLERCETGSEWFSVSRYADGSRTARCECQFDDVGLVRDVTLTLGADWRPIDAYLRINHQGRALGAGWFRFGADEPLITEYSVKYSPERFLALARDAGWRPLGRWSDPADDMSLHLLERADWGDAGQSESPGRRP